MTSKNNNHPPIYASGHYYSKKDFQFPVTAVKKTVSSTTVLKNNNGITLIYFCGGSGSIVINSRPYPVQKGMLICLGSYHYFEIKSSGEPIDLVQCRLSYDAFLYMAANPYYNFSEITISAKPLTAILKDDMLERAEIIVREMVESTARSRKRNMENADKDTSSSNNSLNDFIHKSGDTEFFLCMRLMGILQKTFQKDFWK